VARPVRFYRRRSGIRRLGGLKLKCCYSFLFSSCCRVCFFFFASAFWRLGSASLGVLVDVLSSISFLPPCLFFSASRLLHLAFMVPFLFRGLQFLSPLSSRSALPCPFGCLSVCLCLCPHVLPPYTLRMYVFCPFPTSYLSSPCILYAKSIKFYCCITLPAILRDECV
jgi:hypothetical protein